MPTASTEQPSRAAAIDVARGIAVLGIFTINLPDMGYPEDLVFNPDPTGLGGIVDYWVLLLSETFFAGKMRGLLAIIFGISAALFVTKLGTNFRARSVAIYFYRRLLWLVIFGLVNAYILLWWGDILLKYAILGMLLFPLIFVSWRISAVITLACFCLLALQPVLEYRELKDLKTAYEEVQKARQDGRRLTAASAEVIMAWNEAREDRLPDPDYIDEEIANRSGDYPTIFSENSIIATEEQTIIFVEEDILDILPFMLLGVVVVNSGFLRRIRLGEIDMTLPIVLIAIGASTHLWASAGNIDSSLDPVKSSFYAVFFELGRAPLVVGYLLLILIGLGQVTLGYVGHAIAACGRMAFTNYVTQSLVGMFLFNGFGLSQFSALTRLDLLAVMVGVWVLQIVFSVIWLKYFLNGPLEWLWRSLTYWQMQPFLRIPNENQ